MRVRLAISTAGIIMHTPKIHLCVDGRYAINHYPGIGRVTSALCAQWATHPAISRLDIIINSQSLNTIFALPNENHIHLHAIDAPPFGIREWLSMRSYLTHIRPDWIYAPYFNMPPYVHPTKRLLTIHDAIPYEVGSMPRLRQIALRHIIRTSMSRADRITTVSQHAAQQIRHYYGYHGNIVVIPNGVSDIFWHPADTDTLDPYGISEPYALCVSSNQPHKNIHTLLAAWRMAHEARRIPPQSRLVIAGHVDPHRDMPWMQPCYQALPITHIADPSDAILNALYHRAQMFVLPSLAEGFGLPIIEALAAGCPVLCHDYPTLRQLHGDIVQYTDMHDSHTVAHAISTLWHDNTPRAAHQQRAQSHARTFSWAAVAQQYIDEFHTNALVPR
ncbi:MAG: hypothetical protein RI985_645 [Chloroflexota bacterium]